jgi:hypothetical protein
MMIKPISVLYKKRGGARGAKDMPYTPPHKTLAVAAFRPISEALATRTIEKTHAFINFFYAHRDRRSYFELRSSVFTPTYVTYVRRVADEPKVPRPPRRPACLCSSANLSGLIG